MEQQTTNIIAEPLIDKVPSIMKLAFVCKWTRTERNVFVLQTNKQKKTDVKLLFFLTGRPEFITPHVQNLV